MKSYEKSRYGTYYSPNLSLKDEGNYTCRLTALGQRLSSMQSNALHVKVFECTETIPKIVCAPDGQPTEIHCFDQAPADTIYHWIRPHYPDTVKGNESTLMIPMVNMSSVGQYICTARSDDTRQVFNRTIYLYRKVKPAVPENICTVYTDFSGGMGNATIHWMIERPPPGSYVTNTAKYLVMYQSSGSGDAGMMETMGFNATLDGLMADTWYDVTIRAMNSVGEVMRRFFIVTPPDPETCLMRTGMEPEAGKMMGPGGGGGPNGGGGLVAADFFHRHPEEFLPHALPP